MLFLHFNPNYNNVYSQCDYLHKLLFLHFLKIIITFTASAITSINCCFFTLIQIIITFTASAITSINCCLKKIVSSLSKISNYNNVHSYCDYIQKLLFKNGCKRFGCKRIELVGCDRDQVMFVLIFVWFQFLFEFPVPFFKQLVWFQT